MFGFFLYFSIQLALIVQVTNSSGTNIFSVHKQAYTSRTFHRGFSTSFTRPTTLIPKTILRKSPLIIQTSGIPPSWQRTPTDKVSSNTKIPEHDVKAYIQSMAPFCQNTVGHITLNSEDIPGLAEEIRTGTIVIASDGSVKTDATQGWIIHGPKSGKMEVDMEQYPVVDHQFHRYARNVGAFLGV
jgi:hypothetical protein